MKLQQSLVIHYYFDDVEQHEMDALIKAKADLELLAALKELADLFQLKLRVDTQAVTSGGLVEILTIVSEFKNAAALIALFGLIFTVYSYRDGREARELEKTSKRLSNEEKQLQIDKLKRDLTALEHSQQPQQELNQLSQQILNCSPKIMARRTQYFKTLMQQGDLAQVGFTSLNDRTLHPTEYVIQREHFHHMICIPQKPLPELHTHVLIEVISPVLKPQRSAKWRGIYDKQEIYFTVTDRQFNQKVYAGQIAFSNGTRLRCNLEIRKRIDETGHESIFSYVVPYVDNSAVIDNDQEGTTRATSSAHGRLNRSQSSYAQGDLFHS